MDSPASSTEPIDNEPACISADLQLTGAYMTLRNLVALVRYGSLVTEDSGSGYWWSESDDPSDPWFQYSGNDRPLFVQPFGPVDKVLKRILWSGIGPQELALRIARWRMNRRR